MNSFEEHITINQIDQIDFNSSFKTRILHLSVCTCWGRGGVCTIRQYLGFGSWDRALLSVYRALLSVCIALLTVYLCQRLFLSVCSALLSV